MGMSNLGNLIRTRRKELGISQKEVCRRLGLPESRKSYISGLENGIFPGVSAARLAGFAQALEISADELLNAVTPTSPEATTP